METGAGADTGAGLRRRYTSQAIQQQFAADVPFICLFYRTGAILTRKMFTTVRSIREFEVLRGIEAFGR